MRMMTVLVVRSERVFEIQLSVGISSSSTTFFYSGSSSYSSSESSEMISGWWWSSSSSITGLRLSSTLLPTSETDFRLLERENEALVVSPGIHSDGRCTFVVLTPRFESVSIYHSLNGEGKPQILRSSWSVGSCIDFSSSSSSMIESCSSSSTLATGLKSRESILAALPLFWSTLSGSSGLFSFSSSL